MDNTKTTAERFALLEEMSHGSLSKTIRDVRAFGWLAATWFAQVRA